MCSADSSGIDFGVGKINYKDTTKTLATGVVGLPIYDALVVNPEKAAKQALQAQQEANQIAIGIAKKNASDADMAFNRANGKSPDVIGIMDSNRMNAKGGQSGTMLTGTQGVDPSALLLGRKTLLGA